MSKYAFDEPYLHRLRESRYAFDESYLHRLREHDPATEEHFISYFSQRLNKTLRYAGLLQPEIEDIRQETFRRVWAAVSQGRLRHPQGFGSYVHAICDQVLEENRRSTFKHADIEGKEIPGTESGLEEEALRFEQGVLIQRLLVELPERDRMLLKARFFEDRDTEDLCREFGVDRDYLRVLMHRAVNKFGDLYRKKTN